MENKVTPVLCVFCDIEIKRPMKINAVQGCTKHDALCENITFIPKGRMGLTKYGVARGKRFGLTDEQLSRFLERPLTKWKVS